MITFVTRHFRGGEDITNKIESLFSRDLLSVKEKKHQIDNFNAGQVWK